MWLECSIEASNEAIFTVKDCIFGGGISKETPDRKGRYFKLNIEKRMADIIALSQITNNFSEEISKAINLLLIFTLDSINLTMKNAVRQPNLLWNLLHRIFRIFIPALQILCL